MAIVRKDARALQIPGDGDFGADVSLARWQLPSTSSRPYRLPIKSASGSTVTLAVPGPGALVLSGKTPTLAARAIVPAPDAVVLVGQVPPLRLVLGVPAPDVVATTGYAPTLRRTLSPPAGALSLVGYAPTRVGGSPVTPTGPDPGPLLAWPEVAPVQAPGAAPTVLEAPRAVVEARAPAVVAARALAVVEARARAVVEARPLAVVEAPARAVVAARATASVLAPLRPSVPAQPPAVVEP